MPGEARKGHSRPGSRSRGRWDVLPVGWIRHGSGVTILTIGHGTRAIDEFLQILRRAAVVRLVDVRTSPGSRRNPQFGRVALAEALELAGIAYGWRPDLGGFRRPKPDSRHLALRNSSFRGYADHMESRDFHDAIERLVEISAGRRTAVMCAESVWWRCHRRMIADALVAQGHRVVHLMDAGQKEHELHPNARVVSAWPVYDVVDPPTSHGGEPPRRPHAVP